MSKDEKCNHCDCRVREQNNVCTRDKNDSCIKEQSNASAVEKEDSCVREQKHVHEILGSVKIAHAPDDCCKSCHKKECEGCHNHRFTSVTGEAIPAGPSHVHRVKFKTDFYEDHFHEFEGTTSIAIPVGDGRHVHFIKSMTEESDEHCHEFRVATLINDPIGD